jgi:L-histidine N-alpha-methyltransferase
MSIPPRRFKLIAMDAREPLAAFGRDVRAGLTRTPKRLSCAYFYDREGSRLFEQICELPEYYLTRAERAILETHANAIVSRLANPITLVELGSGNAAKTRLLIEALLRRQQTLCYTPIDICRPVLEGSSLQLLDSYPALDVVAVAAEYHDGLRHLRTVGRGKLILWLGSNVGNFDRSDAGRFLQQVRDTMAGEDRLLLGVDLRKDRAILERAYDDAQGVTAQFNLNLLARINRELGGHFDVRSFRHRAVYNDEVGRIEMYLDSLDSQQVAIDGLGLTVSFTAGEAIHTENSYKYSFTEMNALAASADLRVEQRWLDPDSRVALNLLGVSTSPTG